MALWFIVGGLCFHHASDGMENNNRFDSVLYAVAGTVCLVSGIVELVSGV